MLVVEVAYGESRQQLVLRLEVAEGTSLRQAVEQSGILQRFPQIDPNQMKLGVYGRLRAPGAPAEQGDRIEIYRPLGSDPKDLRRRRVAETRRKKKS